MMLSWFGCSSHVDIAVSLNKSSDDDEVEHSECLKTRYSKIIIAQKLFLTIHINHINSFLIVTLEDVYVKSFSKRTNASQTLKLEGKLKTFYLLYN
jgi:hypothetical protein